MPDALPCSFFPPFPRGKKERCLLDPRFKAYADLLVGHSVKVKPGDVTVIEIFDEIPEMMARATVDAVQRAGGVPIVWLRRQRVTHDLLRYTKPEALEATLKTMAANDLAVMRRAQCYIALRGYANASEMAGVSPNVMKLYGRLYNSPVHLKCRIPKTRWVVNRWPSPSMAQMAKKSTADFEDFFFACTTGVDYVAMAKAARPLVALMKRTNKVHIVGPGDTDLIFSIKGIPAIPCFGEHNIPDGECFTAPVRTSMNGVIEYNTPTICQGAYFEGLRFVVRDGQIVEATCRVGDVSRLNAILDTDPGARYFGEFALGFNPAVDKIMCDTLFDEKRRESFHLTPGNSYDEAPNGNKSAVHWDIVAVQLGKDAIYFDGVLVRRGGLFVPKYLKGLNPDRLMA